MTGGRHVLAIRGPRVSWYLGSAGACAAVTGTWQPARDGFLLTAHPLTGHPAGETLDGYLYPADGRPGCWELDCWSPFVAFGLG